MASPTATANGSLPGRDSACSRAAVGGGAATCVRAGAGVEGTASGLATGAAAIVSATAGKRVETGAGSPEDRAIPIAPIAAIAATPTPRPMAMVLDLPDDAPDRGLNRTMGATCGTGAMTGTS